MCFFNFQNRVKVRGKRRPQTRAARRLAAQESSEAEYMSVSKAQFSDDSLLPNACQPQLRTADGENSSEATLATATPVWTRDQVFGVDRKPFVKSQGQPLKDDLFDSADIFSTNTDSQSTGSTKVNMKAADNSVNPPGRLKEKSPMFPVLSETSSDEDLFQSVKPKPAKKTISFPFLADEDDLFTEQKSTKTVSKSCSQQDVISKTQDIFEVIQHFSSVGLWMLLGLFCRQLFFILS